MRGRREENKDPPEAHNIPDIIPQATVNRIFLQDKKKDNDQFLLKCPPIANGGNWCTKVGCPAGTN